MHKDKKSINLLYKRPVIWNTIMTVGVAVAFVFSLVSSNRMAESHFPRADAAMKIQLEAALGHLWLEEIISGDTHENIAMVWDHLDKAEVFGQQMISGEGKRQKMVLLFRDSETKTEMEKLVAQLIEFRAIAEYRWEHQNNSGIGSIQDQNTDAIFSSLLAQASIVEKKIADSRAKDLHRFQVIQVILILIILGFSVFSGIGFRRYERKQKQIYLALHNSENKTRTTFNVLGDAVFLHPLLEKGYGQFIDVNKTACDLYGYSPEEFFSMTAHDLSSNSAAINLHKSGLHQKINEEKRVIFESVHVTKQGTEFPVEVNSTVIELEGKPVVLAVVRDISDRKLAEELLRESQENYETLFDESPVPLWVEDYSELTKFLAELKDSGINDFRSYFNSHPDDLAICAKKIVIKKVNKAAVKMHKADNKEHLLSNLDKTFTAKSYEVFKEEIIAIADGKMEFESVAEVRTMDCETKNIFLQLTMNPSTLGSDMAMVATFDITEKTKLEAQLRQAQKMESVGLLAGGVAHDFNNMLAVILGNTEMALEEVNEHQPIFGMLEGIKRAGERSADLTKQLLAFARKQTIVPRLLNLNIIVEDTLKMLRRIIGENIELVWVPGLLEHCVKMDPSQINQVLTNLCVNSRDAIGGVGKITIETKFVSLDADYCSNHPGFYPGQYILLTVSDDGEGMTQETIDRIYEPFFSTKASEEGSGLGMSTVYGIIKQNNGFIDVNSEMGSGTSINIYLPHFSGVDAENESPESESSVVTGTETILLVEDERSILEMTQRMLQKHGYNVLAAATPGEALVLAEEHGRGIHLLLSDVIMPDMSGLDLSTRLQESLPELKQLFMSGYTANVIAPDGVLGEGLNFIQKPFAMNDLLVKVRETL